MKKSRSDWQSELLSKQRNLDPMRAHRSILSFEGVLYRGLKNPSPLQRVGAWIVGGTLLAVGATIAWYERLAFVQSLHEKDLVALSFVFVGLLIATLSFVVGLVIAIRAVLPPRSQGQRR